MIWVGTNLVFGGFIGPSPTCLIGCFCHRFPSFIVSSPPLKAHPAIPLLGAGSPLLLKKWPEPKFWAQEAKVQTFIGMEWNGFGWEDELWISTNGWIPIFHKFLVKLESSKNRWITDKFLLAAFPRSSGRSSANCTDLRGHWVPRLGS